MNYQLGLSNGPAFGGNFGDPYGGAYGNGGRGRFGPGRRGTGLVQHSSLCCFLIDANEQMIIDEVVSEVEEEGTEMAMTVRRRRRARPPDFGRWW